jgi:hypothetical protein
LFDAEEVDVGEIYMKRFTVGRLMPEKLSLGRVAFGGR